MCIRDSPSPDPSTQQLEPMLQVETTTEVPPSAEPALPDSKPAPTVTPAQPAAVNGSAEGNEQPVETAKPVHSPEDTAKKSPISPKRPQPTGLSVRFLEIGREYRASGGRKGMPFPWKLWLRLNKEEKSIEMVVDHKQKSAVVRVSLDSFGKLATGTIKVEEEDVPYLVFEVLSTPEFYKLSDSSYTESDDWTQGQASVYSRTTMLFHAPQEDVSKFVDEMITLEESLLSVAAKTPPWPVLIQSGPTLIPVTFPEDPNDIMYMTREQLEQEVLAARRKKASMAQQSRRPPQRRSNSNKGKPPTSPPTGAASPQLTPNVPYTIQSPNPLQPESPRMRATVPVLAPPPVGSGEAVRATPVAAPAPAAPVSAAAPPPPPEATMTGVKRPAPTAIPEA
eukprot:TRINITY_DN7544_c0_g1_i1.p1 TRINITY_DN7544_c0_g1~~TRINITY_DN7544_c0_g1_i1.p1  ORF type:complete len:394 (+),score=65.48 TRINITY_DN7544_c0_g1_i1:47-1228(+)